MLACLESTRRWLRLAFACLAIVAGGLPAQAVVEPEAEAAAAVHRPARARPRSRLARPKPWWTQAPRSLAVLLQRPFAQAAERGHSPPRSLYLDHQALLC